MYEDGLILMNNSHEGNKDSIEAYVLLKTIPQETTALKPAGFEIKMDFRERNSNIAQILKQVYGIEPIEQSLKVGDYTIDERIVIERKTTLDFAQSIIDGRLFKQTTKMKYRFEFPVFIIEGKNLYDTSVDIHPHALKGALISLEFIWQIPVIFSDVVKDTALMLWLIGTQNLSRENELSYRLGRRPKRLRKRQLYILQGLPNIGPKLALRFLEHFGNVEKVITAPKEALIKIQGLGKAKSEKIREVLTIKF